MQTESIDIALIEVGESRRAVNAETVESLAKSIKEIGLRTPITVIDINEGAALKLVAGRHRLKAAESLGWDKIDAFVMEGESIEAEMWEISENLHRAELTTLQRDEQISRWLELAEARQSAQVVPNESKRADGRGHRQESGIRAASREIGVNRMDASRATKVASLSERAKQAAVDAGLDDNRSALLAASKMPTEEAQVEYIQDYAKPKPKPLQHTNHEKQFGNLMAAWNDASQDVRDRFIHQILEVA